MKVSATLKGRTDQLGRQKVYIRIAMPGNKRIHRATSIRIEPKYWDKKVVGHPKAKQINEQIKALILAYESSPPPKPDTLFYTYAISCISEWERSKKPETIRQLRSGVKKFKDFSDLKLSSLSSDTLRRFADYCYSLGNTENTVWKSLKVVRVITLKALREKLISDNPFVSFDMPKYRDPEKIYLTRDQVKAFEKTCKAGPTEYQIAGGWFLISCYTGLRFSDCQRFNKSKIRDGRLVIYTSKTGVPVSFPMNDKIKELFSLVKYKALPFTNVHTNRIIKAIAATAGIPGNISFHTSRHTCATMLAAAGVSIEVTAKILGHQSLKQTSIYYQITGSRIDKELNKIF